MSKEDFLGSNIIRPNFLIVALDNNLFTDFLATMANLRERDNKIASASSNNDQMSEVSKSEAKKAYLDENLDSNLAFDSNIESDFNIEFDSDIESKNENDNNSISTSSQSLQSSTNAATNASN